MFTAIQNRFESALSCLGYRPTLQQVGETNRYEGLAQETLENQTLKQPKSKLLGAKVTAVNSQHSSENDSRSTSFWQKVAALGMSYLLSSSGQASFGENVSTIDLTPCAASLGFTVLSASQHVLEPRPLPLLLMAGFSAFPDVAGAQPLRTTFLEGHGGSVSVQGLALTVTSEKDLLITGYANSFGADNGEVLVSKFASNGTLLWANTLGGVKDELGRALTVTSEGDFFVAGNTESFGAGGTDLLLAKFANNGTLLWANTLGGPGNDQGRSVTVTFEGDLLVAGYTDSFGAGGGDMLICRFASNGTLLWGNTIGGASIDFGHALTSTLEGDFYVTGYAYDFGVGRADVLLTKFSGNGTLLWAKNLGGANTDVGTSLTITSEGDVVVVGETDSFGAGSDDMLLTKFSSNGTFLWANTLGGAGNDQGVALTSTSDGYLIIAGHTNSFSGGNDDILLSKFSRDGILVWASIFGSLEDDFGFAVMTTNEGDLFVTGYTDIFNLTTNDFVLLLAKLNEQGAMENCSSWQSIAPQVQSITPPLADVTLNMILGTPFFLTTQYARSALNTTDITNLLNQTTECSAQIFGNQTSITSTKASSSFLTGSPSLRSSQRSSPQTSGNFSSTVPVPSRSMISLSLHENPSLSVTLTNSLSVLSGSTRQVHSLTSVSTKEESQIDASVTIESIISGEVTVINHPLYGEIPVSYDPETNTLYLSIDLSEFEDGDELELFTYASNFTVDDLSIVVESYSTCKTLENAGAEEESDRSVYVARVVDKSCASGTSSICISFSNLFVTTASMLPSK